MQHIVTTPSLVTPLRLIRPERSLAATLCLNQMSLRELLLQDTHHPFLHRREAACYADLPATTRRDSYLMGRYCAKHALARQLAIARMDEILIENGVFQHPVVVHTAAANVQVSISHSADMGCALAFDECHPMGIDIEPVDERHARIVAPQLMPDETRALEQRWGAGNLLAYTWLWTVKEALGKAVKAGLTVPLALYAVDDVRVDGLFIASTYRNFGQFKSLSFMWKQAVVSIALPKKTVLHLPQPCEAIRAIFFPDRGRA